MEWSAVTRIPCKISLYERETYFREGWADFVGTMGPRALLQLHPLALLLIKPDGLAAGKAPAIMDFVCKNDFSIVAATFINLTRLHSRELWRHQLACATLDRLAANDLVHRGQALLLILRDTTNQALPGSVRLSELKGCSDLKLQPPLCLRRVIGQPNRIFSYFHVSDEPADFIRELGIILEPEARKQVLLTVAGNTAMNVDDLLESVVSDDLIFDKTASLTRLRAALHRCIQNGCTDSRTLDTVSAAIERMTAGEPIAWCTLELALKAADIQLDRWDKALLAASFITYDEPPWEKAIGAVDPELWRSDIDFPTKCQPS